MLELNFSRAKVKVGVSPAASRKNLSGMRFLGLSARFAYTYMSKVHSVASGKL